MPKTQSEARPVKPIKTQLEINQEHNNENTIFAVLPVEVMLFILSLLNTRDLFSTSLVCKLFRQLAKDSTLPLSFKTLDYTRLRLDKISEALPRIYCILPLPNYTLALGHQDGTITLWDVEKNEPIENFVAYPKEEPEENNNPFEQITRIQRNSTNSVTALTLCDDQRNFASSSSAGVIKIWRIANNQLTRTIENPPCITQLTTLDSQHIATSYGDSRNLFIWNTKKFTFDKICLPTKDQHGEGQIKFLIPLSPNTVAVFCFGGRICVYQHKDPKIVEIHKYYDILSAAKISDNRIILHYKNIDHVKNFSVWNFGSDNQINDIQFNTKIEIQNQKNPLKFLQMPNESFLLVTDKTIYLLDANTFNLLGSYQNNNELLIDQLCLHTDGRLVAVTTKYLADQKSQSYLSRLTGPKIFKKHKAKSEETITTTTECKNSNRFFGEETTYSTPTVRVLNSMEVDTDTEADTDTEIETEKRMIIG